MITSRCSSLVPDPNGRSLQVFRQDSVVAVDLGVAQVGHHRLLQAADPPLLLQLPGPQPVLGVPQDVLEGQPQDGGVLDLLEVEQEGDLSFQSFSWKTILM